MEEYAAGIGSRCSRHRARLQGKGEWHLEFVYLPLAFALLSTLLAIVFFLSSSDSPTIMAYQEKIAELTASEVVVNLADNDTGLGMEKRGTEVDQRDMRRMGKSQELRRNFRFVTIFGFMMVLMATWEAQLECGSMLRLSENAF